MQAVPLNPLQYFDYVDGRLAYREFGEGSRIVVLLHGLLLNQRMHEPLAELLAARGNRVITLDLLGHGESDRPADMTRYAMRSFGLQTIALLDHLGADDAVVGGTSLGANVTLEAADIAPERLRGMFVDMPVLEHALVATGIAFTPALAALTLAEPVARLVARIARMIPRQRLPLLGNIILDTLRQEPAPSAAVLAGLFFGEIAPDHEHRIKMKMPTLVLGHRSDPIHPFSDAGMLLEELPAARLVEASSLIELRTSPDRLAAEIAEFLDDCWRPRGVTARSRRAARPKATRASS